MDATVIVGYDGSSTRLARRAKSPVIIVPKPPDRGSLGGAPTRRARRDR